MHAKPDVVADCKCTIGEAPLWHPMEKKLYWLDIPLGRIYRYDPAAGEHELCHEGEPIGGFTIQVDGALLLFMAKGAVKTWHDGKMTAIIDEIPPEADSLFNDVIADPAGRVFCGTKASKTHLGRIYRLDPNGELTLLREGFEEPNGFGFTLDRKHLFSTDTLKQTIYISDYYIKTGNICNDTPFIHVPEGEGVPDGMTVDSEGFVWSAHWGGGRIVRYTPDGSVDSTIHLPVKKTSSLTFGGEDYKDIYITTSGGDNRLKEGPEAGCLFHVNLGIQGLPEFRSKVML